LPGNKKETMLDGRKGTMAKKIWWGDKVALKTKKISGEEKKVEVCFLGGEQRVASTEVHQ